MIEEEIVHWWNDDKGEKHRTLLRVESENAREYNGFPRDGLIKIKIANTTGYAAIKLNPDEALRLSTQLLSIAKELLNQKREMWNKRGDD